MTNLKRLEMLRNRMLTAKDFRETAIEQQAWFIQNHRVIKGMDGAGLYDLTRGMGHGSLDSKRARNGRAYEWQVAIAINMTAFENGLDIRMAIPSTNAEKHLLASQIVPDTTSLEYDIIFKGLDGAVMWTPSISLNSPQANFHGQLGIPTFFKASYRDRFKEDIPAIEICKAAGFPVLYGTVGMDQEGTLQEVNNLLSEHGLSGVDLFLHGSRNAEEIDDRRLVHFVHVKGHPTVVRAIEQMERLIMAESLSDDERVA